jgi:glycosyltransferase involved in cell wall biosynthesis
MVSIWHVSSTQRVCLSVVVPAHNEEQALPEFHRRLCAVLDALELDAEVVFVNDGSTDATARVLERLRAGDPRIALVDLSRNYGKEIALTAGLDHARGDAVVVIDADLQEPPELIPQLVAAWREGYDVVYARRAERAGDSAFRKATAHLFYRLIGAVSRVEIPADTGDYRLMSRRAVQALCQLREQHRYMKGLFAWIGFPQKAVPYQREPRFAGRSKFSYWKLWNFAIEGLTSFTIAPLKVSTYLGLAVALFAFVYGLRIIYKTLVHGDPVAGYPSMMVTMLFLGGVQLVALGVLGEYVGRMFDETKRRPLYFLNGYSPPTRESGKQPSAAAFRPEGSG